MHIEACFRLTNGEGGSAEHVTSTIGINPTTTCEVGDPVTWGPEPRVRGNSAWVLSADASSTVVAGSKQPDDYRLHHALDHLLDQLEPVTEALWQLEATGYQANWLCLLGTRDGEHASEIPRATMKRLCDLPGDLWLDVYVDDEPPG